MVEWFLGQISLPHPLCMSTIVRMLIVMCSFGIKDKSWFEVVVEIVVSNICTELFWGFVASFGLFCLVLRKSLFLNM